MTNREENGKKPGRGGGFVPVGDVLGRIMGDFSDRPQSKGQKLGGLWVHAVGEQVAKHSQPERLARGLLTVRVDSPVWLTQLLHMKSVLLAKLYAVSSDTGIRDLRFVQGSLRTRSTSQGEKSNIDRLPPPNPEEVQRAMHMVASVVDSDLRAALQKLAQTMLVRRRCG
ncbi:MAG: DUF721 domain-containing protein [Magnetococcales bacterium]|nr:DUF721 domain-containing protein [Magnetococcales bacterium]